METESQDKASPEYIRLAYQSALEDIRFFKKQQFTVTNYTLLIYAAIIAIFKEFRIIGLEGWIAAVIMISILAILLIIQLQFSLCNVRARKENMKKELLENSRIKDLLFKDSSCSISNFLDQNSVFSLLLLIIIAGGIFPVLILLAIPCRL